MDILWHRTKHSWLYSVSSGQFFQIFLSGGLKENYICLYFEIYAHESETGT